MKLKRTMLILSGILFCLLVGVFTFFYAYEWDKAGTEFTLYTTAKDNKVNQQAYYIVKKYNYSKRKMLIGFGGGSSTKTPVYAYGFADANKTLLLEPKFDVVDLVQISGYSTEQKLLTMPAIVTTDLPNIKTFYTLQGEKINTEARFGKNAKLIIMNDNGLRYTLLDTQTGKQSETEYGMQWITPDSIEIEKRKYIPEKDSVKIWMESTRIED